MKKKILLVLLIMVGAVLILLSCTKKFDNPIDPDIVTSVPPKPINLELFSISSKAQVQGRFSYTYENTDGIVFERSLKGNNSFGSVDTLIADTTFIDSINLDYNTEYDYRVFGYNENGISKYSNIVSVKTSVAPDIVGPTVSMLYPLKDSVVVGEDSIRILMAIIDSSGVGIVTVKGDTALYDTTEKRYYYDLALSDGKNSFTIIAKDVFDNITSVDFDSIFYEPTLNDVATPVLSGLSVAGNVFINDSASVEDLSVQLTGKIFDSSGIKSIVVNDSIGAISDSTWNVTVNLANGVYTPIYIVVTDNSVNKNIFRDTMYIIVQTDLVAPVVTITSHLDSALVDVDSITISGTVQDESGIYSMTCLGVDAKITNDSLWSVVIKDLSLYTYNKLIIDTRDNSKSYNLKRNTIYVYYDPTIGDTISPILSVSSHNTDGTARTGDSTINISGVVTDLSGVTSVKVNSVTCAISDDTVWTVADVSISKVHNEVTEIEVVAIDGSYWKNSDTVKFDVVFDSSLSAGGDTEGPIFTVQDGLNEFDTIIITQNPYIFNGNVSDQSEVKEFKVQINGGDFIFLAKSAWNYSFVFNDFTNIMEFEAIDSLNNLSMSTKVVYYDQVNKVPKIIKDTTNGNILVKWNKCNDVDFSEYKIWVDTCWKVDTSKVPNFHSINAIDTVYEFPTSSKDLIYYFFVLFIDSLDNGVSFIKGIEYDKYIPENMKLIPAGLFVDDVDSGWNGDTAYISYDFWMDSTEVTQVDFENKMGFNSSMYLDDNNPMERMTWYDAILYCNIRSKLLGLDTCYTYTAITMQSYSCQNLENILCDFNVIGIRLPTEDEWELAARGGQQLMFSTDDGTMSSAKSNYNNNIRKTVGVGSYPPNPFGLYDIAGNVWELVWDLYGNDTNRINNRVDYKSHYSGIIVQKRGGAYDYSEFGTKSGHRNSTSTVNTASSNGFRCILPIQ